jgi:hypothetical protein
MPGNPDRGCSNHSRIGKAFVLSPQNDQVAGLVLGYLDNLFGCISPPDYFPETTPRTDIVGNPSAKAARAQPLPGPRLIGIR